MDDRRVADYFVVAGLDKEQQLPLEEFSNEAITKPGCRQDPITDITVINRSLGEKVPKGYECLELTPSGFPANLNHGSIRCPDMFICYRRGRDKPPLKDLGILYEGKERVMEGCEVVHTTMQGNPANVNNSSSSRTYITYRRAEKSAPSDTLVVVDICVILGNRGEEPPLTFLKILKNLNKGMLGSDVFLCYKKAMVRTDVLAYKASILGRYPAEDYEDFPVPESVPMFCLPMGATIECWSAEAQHPVPSFSTFILTGAGGEKVYGAAVGFYEEYREEDLTDMQMRSLGLKNKQIREQYRIPKTVHIRKSIALLSHWPFFDAFKKFLSQLYKISITGPHMVPIERHISHFMYDVPYPSPERPRILVQLAHDSLSLCMPEDSPLPQSGASFITLLRNLGPELTMNLLLFVLLESKILLHSLRPTVLTEVAEAVSSMIFPFHWQCPYIPLCPLGLSDVLNAPCPFIVGVDSRYFDLYDPPPDVICVDLDTNRIQMPEDRKALNYKFLPKKPARVMHESLSKLYEKASQPNVMKNDSDEVSLEMTHFDLDFRRKKQNMQIELAIQEVFLRFSACLLKDYKSYLNPIMKAPNSRATDASSLFDMQGFLKSRDKTTTKFYHQLMYTQMFFRFIEERSFVSDKDASLAFFDECTEKVDEAKDEPRLIEIENTLTSERTVFIMPPEPVGLPEGVKYCYNGFPVLKPELFLCKKKPMLTVPAKQLCPNSPLARRTKQEVRSAQKVALQQVGNPVTWAKCLLSYSYSLWFVVFPAYVQFHPKKTEALKIGLAVLRKMQDARLSAVDELCYRVMMQLAGQYNKPGMAVQVFSQMKKHGVHPNAITYGYYNKVMLEAKWPSPQSRGHLRWLKIRNVILGVAQFRRALRRRSMSIYSNSGSEFDRVSHTSADSYLAEPQPSAKADADRSETTDASSTAVVKEEKMAGENDLNKNSSSSEEQMSTDGVSDRGYNSMTKEDVKLMSQIVVTADDSGSASSSAASEYSEKSRRLKFDSWNPLNLNFLGANSGKAADKVKKEVHIVDDNIKRHSGRPRVGSIVKRSASSVSSRSRVDDFEMLKGSLLNNASGLVILSQASLERSSMLPEADLQMEVEEAKRRRHRSAGEGPSKPSRSMSLFASWRSPRNNSAVMSSVEGGADSTDLVKTEERSCLSFSKSEIMKTSECASGNNTGSEACTNVTPSNQSDVHSDSFNRTVVHGKPLMTISELEASSQDHLSCRNSGQILGNDPSVINSYIDPKDGSDVLPCTTLKTADYSQSMVLLNPLEPAAQTDTSSVASDSSNLPSDIKTDSRIGSKADDSSDDNLTTVIDRSDIRRSVSVSDNRLSSQFHEVPFKQSLGEMGRALSSPGGDIPMDSRLLEKRSSEDAQSVSSLSDSKKERSNDMMLRRSQSLKKTKAIGTYLKWASQAAYTKFNELKQTITTPIKNGSLGSLGSLTHSAEELDANDGSSTSGTIRDRVKHGGSQELLSHSEESDTEEADKRISGISFESAASSCLDGMGKLNEASGNASSGLGVTTEKLTDDLVKVAMEVEISSCSRCTKCSRLIYDEEIMAGWSAEDSNLNTSCPYCHAKFVPHLQIYIKDWRGDPKSVVPNSEQSYPTKEKLLAKCDQQAEPNTNAKLAEELQEQAQNVSENSDLLSRTNEASKCPQQHDSSERFDTAKESLVSDLSLDSSMCNVHQQSFSAEEDSEQFLPSSADAAGVKKEFMTRSPSSSEPTVVPYLSPLVLRKEVEYVLEHEGDMCLAEDTFVEEHPILFWNLVWFFCRLDVPTHLTSFLLSSRAFSCNKPENLARYKGMYSSQNILIRPQWDNVRIHDELGLPMYSAWRAGHKSTVVDALDIDSGFFTRSLMWQIVTFIKQNDVLSGIKQIAGARRRMTSRKRRFRSMYREILFLSFVACGRENIDHDAFDREYTMAFNEKLQKAEKLRLQLDDHPKADNIQWCRKVFSELEV